MAERAPGKKQVAEAEERAEKENPGKARGAALREDPEGKWRGQKWREAKRKRGTRELPTIGQLLSKRGSCGRNTSAF